MTAPAGLCTPSRPRWLADLPERVKSLGEGSAGGHRALIPRRTDRNAAPAEALPGSGPIQRAQRWPQGTCAGCAGPPGDAALPCAALHLLTPCPGSW